MGLYNGQKNNKNNKKKRKKKKKQNLFMSIVTGLIPWKGDSVTEIFRKIIFLFALVILVVALVIIANHFITTMTQDPNQITVSGNGEVDKETENATYVVDLKNQEPTKEQLDQLPSGTINAEYAALYDQNNDFVGWITIDGTNVDYPVMQSQAADFKPCNTYETYGYCTFCEGIMNGTETANEFYLHHDFNRNYLFAGNIFADYEGLFGPGKMPNNTILYGHNMLYKFQFSALTNYKKLDFLQRSPVVDFNTLYQSNQYKIFAVFLTNVTEDYGEVFDYYNYVDFENSDEFYNYILECMDRSMFETGVDIEYGDELLTLSTCDASAFEEDVRLVICARKVRENESPEVDISKIVRKSSIKYFEAYENAYGSRWTGRTWDISLVKGMAEYLKKHGLEDPAE